MLRIQYYKNGHPNIIFLFQSGFINKLRFSIIFKHKTKFNFLTYNIPTFTPIPRHHNEVNFLLP